MDWVQLGDVAAWAGVVAAVALASWSRRSASKAATKAEEAQGRSTRALELAADAQNRLAAVAEAEANRYDVRWEIDPVGGSRYSLVNRGEDTAYDVSIEAPFIFDSPVKSGRVRKGEAVRFVAARSAVDVVVTVHWYREPGQNGQRQEWVYPLFTD